MKTPLLLIYCISVSYAQNDCSNTDDDELCESSGDGLFEGSGYAVDGKLLSKSILGILIHLVKLFFRK